MLMDGIDCHNRPTHLFETPPRAADALLQRQAELRALPFCKREIVKAVSAGYATHELGLARVRDAIRAFYRESYPDIAGKQAVLVARAAAEAARIYDRTVFPEMKTSSQTHPNNTGHEASPGCFRCHDGNMKSAATGATIPDDGETCHGMLVDGETRKPDLTKLALPAAAKPAPDAAKP